MKELVKSTFFATLKFIETAISCFSVILFSSFSAASKFKYFKKTNKDAECFIMGNGSSLKKVLNEQIEIFESKDIFTVNLFFETVFFQELKPSGHIIADEGFWKGTDDARILGIQKDFIKNLLLVYWDMKLFIPYEGYKQISGSLKSNPHLNFIPYNRTPVTGYKKITHFLYRMNLGMPKPTNVLNAAIFLGLNLGYKKIYLYGADHSWISDLFVDDENNICCYENHFYDETRKFSKMPKGSLSIGLKSIVEALESYRLLDIYAKQIGAAVINKTTGSFVDEFDRE